MGVLYAGTILSSLPTFLMTVIHLCCTETKHTIKKDLVLAILS